MRCMITKEQLEQLILWGASYKGLAEETRVVWEKDEEELLQKLRDYRSRKLGCDAWNYGCEGGKRGRKKVKA